MKIRSPAKINLGLEVVRKRPDGYHDIRTLFQSVDFWDILEFKLLAGGEIRLRGSGAAVPWDERNLVFQAALLLKKEFGVVSGVSIQVQKSVPPGRGLGGGSSNAAMTLYALNELWSLGLSREQLMERGRLLGADIPYFLRGGLCLGTGRGDSLEPLEDLGSFDCVLSWPSFPVATASVYESLRPPLTSPEKDSKIMRFLSRRDVRGLENSLEKTVFRLHPQLRTYKSLFRSLEPELFLVSGTGSAVFGLFREHDKARALLAKLKQRGESVLVETLPRERYWDAVRAGV